MTVFESLAHPVFPIEMIVNLVGDNNEILANKCK